MSQLKLFQPEGPSVAACDGDDRPHILPLRGLTGFQKGRRMLNIVARARLLRENRCCPECSHPVVEPIELDDALPGRNHLPVPGTATLVGFHCQRCHAEWPAR